MSRVLVTGGNGFIGSHLVDALAASGKHEVLVLGPRPRPYDELPADATFVQGDVRDANLLKQVRGRELLKMYRAP